jgi:alkylhydroperoxidase family enzyme
MLKLLSADEPFDSPKPVPTTRPALKAALEALKNRRARLPLPEGAESHSSYLPKSWGGGGMGTFGHAADSNKLKDLLADTSFWVVSRANNCLYCLGHQEVKLRAAGLNDDTIAALDSNWRVFDPRQQAALAFARKLTLDPHLISDEDIARLKKHFSDTDIIELSFNVARFNAVNRWTDGLGLPQERYFTDEGERTLLSPTSKRFQGSVSVVTAETRSQRPSLPTLAEIIQAIKDCHDRESRVAVPSEAAAAASLGDAIGQRKPLNWERAMAPLSASALHVAALNHVMADEQLGVQFKSELALTSAIHNRAWYAAGHAVDRLERLGVSPNQIEAVLKEKASDESGPNAARRLAAKLTAHPHLITDADIAEIRKYFSDAETAQIVNVICIANFFDRFTQALGLPLESGICD